MIRSEYAANVLLRQAPTPTTWTQPSRCNRKPRGWLCRLLGR